MKKVSLVVVTESDQEAILISNLMQKSEIGLNGLLTLKAGSIEELNAEESIQVGNLVNMNEGGFPGDEFDELP